jgi:hypothetical protein
MDRMPRRQAATRRLISTITTVISARAQACAIRSAE